MKGKFGVKLIICLSILMSASIPKSLATEYQGDGTYRLLVGDKVKASNGYTIELVLAWGAFGSRSDWRTDLIIYHPQGEELEHKVTYGNYTNETSGPIETNTLYIAIERYIENEAIITVTSKYEVTTEFPQTPLSLLILALSVIIMLTKFANKRRLLSEKVQLR